MPGAGRFHRVGPVRAGGEETGRESVPGPRRVACQAASGTGTARGTPPGGVTIVDPAPFLTTVMVLANCGRVTSSSRASCALAKKTEGLIDPTRSR